MTENDLRSEILSNYYRTHAAAASAAMYASLEAAWPHYEANYTDLLEGVPSDAQILEIGSGHGSLLAWLRSRGFTSVSGIDVSPDDVAFANAHLGPGVVAEGDFIDLLQRTPPRDVIIMKAVLEHIPKSLLLPALDALHGGLRRGGRLIVEVPNMDWLLAGHERYMDLSHEVGFTEQSLRMLLRLRFEGVAVRGSRLAQPTRSQRLLRPLLLAVLRRALYVLGEGANDTLFAHRSLVAVVQLEPKSA